MQQIQGNPDMNNEMQRLHEARLRAWNEIRAISDAAARAQACMQGAAQGEERNGKSSTS